MKSVQLAGLIVMAMIASASVVTASAESLTLCGRKVEYDPAPLDPTDRPGKGLIGIWTGEILAANFGYGLDYRRCWALTIGRVTRDGEIQSQVVLADSAKQIQNGATYGTKGYVIKYKGQLGNNGSTIRLASSNGKTIYDLKVTGEARIQGRVTYENGNGTVFLSKQ